MHINIRESSSASASVSESSSESQYSLCRRSNLHGCRSNSHCLGSDRHFYDWFWCHHCQGCRCASIGRFDTGLATRQSLWSSLCWRCVVGIGTGHHSKCQHGAEACREWVRTGGVDTAWALHGCAGLAGGNTWCHYHFSSRQVADLVTTAIV